MTPDSPHRPATAVASPPSRRAPWIAAGLGLAALLAGVALLSGGGREPSEARAAEAERPRRETPSFGEGPGPASGPVGVIEAQAAPRHFEAGTCWRELERFNEEVSIETFRDWAAPLLASKDPLVRDYLKERLAELIGNNADNARQVLSWARESEGPEFKVLLSALRDSEAVQQPGLAAQLLDSGLDPTLETGRRAGMLSALDSQKRLEPGALTRLADFARDPVSAEAGWAATRTIGRVMKKDFAQGGDVSPYMDRLLTIGKESPDEQIRYLAESIPMHSAPVLDAKTTERYARLLTTEGNESGRDAAAHNLSLSQDKQKVLQLFEEAFATDPSVCARWAFFRFSARAAGKDALPVMANMALADPRFQRDYQIFEQLYASGIVDFVRVWNSLPDQDPHDCMDRHD